MAEMCIVSMGGAAARWEFHTVGEAVFFPVLLDQCRSGKKCEASSQIWLEGRAAGPGCVGKGELGVMELSGQREGIKMRLDTSDPTRARMDFGVYGRGLMATRRRLVWRGGVRAESWKTVPARDSA